MERHLQKFQFRLQQHLNLADDEINRLQAYKNSLQAELTDITDKLTRFDRQLEQTRNLREGKKKRNSSERERRISFLKAKHSERMTELENSQNQALVECQRDFQTALEEIEEWTAIHLKEDVAPITMRIDQVKSNLKQGEVQSGKIEPTIGEYGSLRKSIMFDNDRIQRLEKTFKERTESRLDMLIKLKERLSDAVSTLEALDRDYNNKVSRLQRSLESVDNSYETKTKAMQEKQEREMSTLQRKLDELKHRSSKVEKTMKEQAETSGRQLTVLLKSADKLKGELEISEPAIENQSFGLKESLNTLTTMQADLEAKENLLLQSRMENESLKREIARLRHENAIRMRRSKLF